MRKEFSEEEKLKFVSLMVEIGHKVEDALTMVHNREFPEINSEVTSPLSMVGEYISVLGCMVADGHLVLEKPVEESEMNQYELTVFRGRGNVRNILVTTELSRESFENDDQFLVELVKTGGISVEVANMVSNIKTVSPVEGVKKGRDTEYPASIREQELGIDEFLDVVAGLIRAKAF